MSGERAQVLSDEALDAIARRYFSDVRAQHLEGKRAPEAVRMRLAADGGLRECLSDWLFGDSECGDDGD